MRANEVGNPTIDSLARMRARPERPGMGPSDCGASRPLGPDFFIVGAPKCGTTSLNAYLGEHPAVFMAQKEQHYWGADLAETWSKPTAEKYFGSFADSGDALRRGEGSGWYLWSRDAAREIREYDPAARIIIMLRNPVEMLPSLHSQYLWDGIEDLTDFQEAFSAEMDRRQGRRIPPHEGPNPWRLYYRDVVRFDKQVGRYFETFGRDKVHVVLFDDFVGDLPGAYRRVLEFLDVDPSYSPAFRVMNANKRVRSRRVKQSLRVLNDPSARLRHTGRCLVPVPAVRRLLVRSAASALKRLNTSVESRTPLDRVFRAELAAELAPGIDALGALLQRDLTSWYRGRPDQPLANV